MTIKQKNIVFGITSLFICFCFSLFLNNTDVAAYTCSYSGPNNSGKEDNYNLVSEGNAGSCYYMRADARDNSKKEEIFENGRATGRYQCTGGTVLHSDGDCWTYEKKYTNYKPTYDDGSEIPDSAFQAACQRQGTYYGAHYNYDRDNHSCEAGTGCSLPSNNETEGPGINFGGDCRKVGDGTQTAGEILGADPTKAKADECKNAGLALDPKTNDCKWTQDKCPQKDGGQGVWVNGQCRAFSDFTNADECKRNGGEFKLLQKAGETGPGDTTLEEDRYECVRPGSDGSDDQAPGDPAQCLKDGNGNCIGGTFEEVTGECGDARTNIISCEGEGGEALGNVLRVFVVVLSVSIGIAAVGGLAYASVLYAKAEDNSGNVSSARTLILNIVIGLFLYGFLIAIVNWLIPGGVIG